GARRKALLKIFRRCVSAVCDTEATQKITIHPTRMFVDNFGHTFKPIATLKEQFADLNNVFVTALAVSVGEHDKRGEQGSVLEIQFCEWFEERFMDRLSIERGRIELSKVIP